jgi:hypothetical protein
MTNDNNNTTILSEVKRPCLDDTMCCYDFQGNKIKECVISDNGNIKGINDSDNSKALYVYETNEWLYGKNIGSYNLINLRERTQDERLKIIEKANESKRRNIENKKNFNELAKAMLEQTLSNKQIQSILGDNTSMLLDDSVASVILGSMIQGALNGSFKCAEFVRDTAGYKPKNELEVSADIMTDNDKALIEKALKSG